MACDRGPISIRCVDVVIGKLSLCVPPEQRTDIEKFLRKGLREFCKCLLKSLRTNLFGTSGVLI